MAYQCERRTGHDNFITLYNGRSLRQIIIGVSLFLAFQAIRKVKNMFNSD